MMTPTLFNLSVLIVLVVCISGQNILVDTFFGPAVSRKMWNGEVRYRFLNEINIADTKRVATKLKNSKYNPSNVDWVSVASACKATCRFERRLCNFYIRAAAHDAFAIAGNYGGMDGSLVLTEDELRRQENNYDSFAIRLSKNYLSIAKRFDASVADVIAVCGAVAVEFAGGPQILKYDKTDPFLVGRYDSDEPNPRTLAKAKMNTTEFVKFAQDRGFTVQEMTALMGSHSMLDEKGCLKNDNTLCDPDSGKCENQAMYTWSNEYYRETCNLRTVIYDPAVEIKKTTTRKMDRKAEKCRFSSKMFQEEALSEFDKEADYPEEPDAKEYINVDYFPKKHGVPKWSYTVHDAWMGRACQDKTKKDELIVAMRTFRSDQKYWNRVFERAYKKMINLNVNWAYKNGFPITGKECRNSRDSDNKTINCYACEFIPTFGDLSFRMFNKTIIKSECDPSCKCFTELRDNDLFYEGIIQ